MRIKYFLWIALFSFLLILVPSVFAAGKPNNTGKNANLKACQVKEEVVKNRFESLSQLANNMLLKFTTIADKVKEYYSTKVIPTGKTLTNFDNLVSDIQTKKTEVQTVLVQAQNRAAGFTCTTDNPKGKMTQFRDDMRLVKSALKDYRTSIRNLIVAVHSLSND